MVMQNWVNIPARVSCLSSLRPCIHPVLRSLCPASILSFIPSFMHHTCTAKCLYVLYFISPVLRLSCPSLECPFPSCPSSILSYISPFLHTYCTASLLHPTSPSCHLSCFLTKLYPPYHATVLSCIPPVLHPTRPASHQSFIPPVLHSSWLRSENTV